MLVCANITKGRRPSSHNASSLAVLLQQIERNDVKIPPCSVNLAFPVWTKESLVIDQAIKRKVESSQKELKLEKEAALEKYKACKNPIQALFLYREAAAAIEKSLWLKGVSHIPEEREVIELANGLVMSNKGNIWKSGAAFGWGNQQNKWLGRAVMTSVDNDTV